LESMLEMILGRSRQVVEPGERFLGKQVHGFATH
jgi:hypothetical protein